MHLSLVTYQSCSKLYLSTLPFTFFLPNLYPQCSSSPYVPIMNMNWIYLLSAISVMDTNMWRPGPFISNQTHNFNYTDIKHCLYLSDMSVSLQLLRPITSKANLPSSFFWNILNKNSQFFFFSLNQEHIISKISPTILNFTPWLASYLRNIFKVDFFFCLYKYVFKCTSRKP